MSRAQKPHNGFSLIELSLVVVIVGLLAAVAIPRFNSQATDQLRLKNQAKRLASDLRLARYLAISKRANHILNINTTAMEYALYQGSVSTANIVFETRSIDSHITVTGNVTYTFLPKGDLSPVSDPATSFVIGSKRWTVTTTVATGFVAVGET